jgi:hypothetical protein
MMGLAALACVLLMFRQQAYIKRQFYLNRTFERGCLQKGYVCATITALAFQFVIIWLFPYPEAEGQFTLIHRTDPKVYNVD